MAKRKTGDFVESIFDLGLGALGAAAHGFGEMTKLRKERKEAKDGDRDIVDDITKGMQASVDRFKEVVDQAATELLPHNGPEEKKLDSLTLPLRLSELDELKARLGNPAGPKGRKRKLTPPPPPRVREKHSNTRPT